MIEYPCIECGKEFLDLFELAKHLNKHAIDKIKQEEKKNEKSKKV